LAEAASLLPFMTEYEHGQVSRLAAILLLGFLLPHSTGNEFFLLQNQSSLMSSANTVQTPGSKTAKRDDHDTLSALINMPLEERLQMASQKYNPDGFGELDTIVHEPVDQAFYFFLDNAIRPFLNGRPAHTQQVDLLHILAMAIHPHPNEQAIRETVSELEEKEDTSNTIWTATRLLMNNMVANSFQVHYQHRLALVKIVTDCLVLPEIRNHSKGTPLLEGAIPHLRASLYAFGLAAMSPYDAHWAQCGLVSVSIQTGNPKTIKEEWGRLLNRMVDDRTDYKCCHPTDDCTASFSFMIENADNSHHEEKDSFCPHRARGHLLERFLTRYSQSRHYAEEEFLQHALGTLTEAIEWLLECWTKSSYDNDDDHQDGGDEKGEKTLVMDDESDEKDKKDKKTKTIQTTNDPPCVLASLLFAAKQLFYYLLPITNSDGKGEEESEESLRRDMLVSCGIQLIHHSDKDIAKEASHLLVLAFCYGPDAMITDYVGAVFESTKLALDEAFRDSSETIAAKPQLTSISIEGMISTFARKSESYADAMLSHLSSSTQQNKWNVDDKKNKKFISVCRLIAVISTASPVAAMKHIDKLLVLLKSSDLKEEPRRHLAVAALACRMARFFSHQSSGFDTVIVAALTKTSFGWDHYLLARHAMVTGNFGIAKILYQQVSHLPSSESSFLWLSVLEQVAAAEESLSINAAKGIPAATEQLRSAASFLHSLSSFSESPNVSFAFQTSFVNLRLDFLDLLVNIRQLTREMRVTCVGPKKNTRPSLHLRNCVNYFNVLATKYLKLYRQHGLFVDQQSRTSLRTFHALCQFVAGAAKSTFVDVLPEGSVNKVQKVSSPKGDACHPLTILMQKLDSAVLNDMNSSVDAKIRAAAMLEIIDSILGAPCPFPRDFVLTKSIPCASMRLSGDSDSEHIDAEYDVDDEIDVPPGSDVTFYASGSLPAALLRRSKIPFCSALLWHTITLCEAVTEDETQSEETVDLKTESFTSFKKISAAPTSASISSNGAFFMKVECPTLAEEGLYNIETILGCRDIRGGEWELPLKESNHSILIRVGQSKS
jgi:integrator complex subunit 7